MRLALLAPVLATTLVAACSDDAHDSATFASATDVQLLRVIQIAQFDDVGEMLALSELFGANLPGCPAVATSGQVTTITTDCTRDNGWTLTGRVVITNFGFDDEAVPARDRSQPSTVEAYELRGSRGDEVQLIDGKVEVVMPGLPESSPFDLIASLDSRAGGLGAHTEGTIRCDASESCLYDGAWIGVDTVGEATIDDGRFDDANNAITLRGQDTLVLAAERDDQGCFAVTIDGAARQVCDGSFRRATTSWSSILR